MSRPEVLDSIGLELRCPLCGGYCRLPLKSLSIQRMLHDGCPVSDVRECPPVFYGPLMEPGLPEEVSTVWTQTEDRARRRGGRVVMLA